MRIGRRKKQSPPEAARALQAEAAQIVQEELSKIVPVRRDKSAAQEWRVEAQELLDIAAPDQLPHSLIRRVERQDLKIRRGLSFKSFIVQQSESRRLGNTSPPWLLDQKLAAYEFVDRINVRRPKCDTRTYTFEDLERVPSPSVLKPRRSTGSKGVYLVYAEDEIVHVRDGARFGSLAGMREHAADLMNRQKHARPLPDRWMLEELILEDTPRRIPGRDLKFFCFYGEVLFTLEVRRNEGQSEYSFKLPDQSSFKPGDWDYTYFEGQGTTAEQRELAASISSQIPHPFCRIDMLKSEDGLVLGEFTPRPGGYNRFSPEWDRTMGEAWARAEHRLQQDLLAGKRFDAFLGATPQLEQRAA